jgi:hypothetical protein
MKGWLSAIGWQVHFAGVCFMVSGIIQALIALNDESYVPQRWHGTLITIAIIFNAIMFNTFLAVKLPLIEGNLLGLHICGVFAIVVPALTRLLLRHGTDLCRLLYRCHSGLWDLELPPAQLSWTIRALVAGTRWVLQLSLA